MFAKDMKIAFLLDFYRDVLDEHSLSIMTAYYEDDLSLSEIAACEGISRQGVRHVIKKSEEQLAFLEDKLGLAERFSKIDSGLRELSKIANNLKDSDDQRLRDLSREILIITEKIAKEN